MTEYLPELLKNPLFTGITEKEDLLSILISVNARVASYRNGNIIIGEGDEVNDIGIILAGEAQASMLDLSGKRFILSRLSTGNIFGDVLSVSSRQKSPVTVVATDTTTALLIPFVNIVGNRQSISYGDNRLLINLLNIISLKYFELQGRISCIIKPTLREKILFYLNSVSKRENNSAFCIPFSREALAEYLNAERSALSRELSAMKKEGIIDYYKNSFKIL